jgi:hypothetical protein
MLTPEIVDGENAVGTRGHRSFPASAQSIVVDNQPVVERRADGAATPPRVVLLRPFARTPIEAVNGKSLRLQHVDEVARDFPTQERDLVASIAQRAAWPLPISTEASARNTIRTRAPLCTSLHAGEDGVH